MPPFCWAGRHRHLPWSVSKRGEPPTFVGHHVECFSQRILAVEKILGEGLVDKGLSGIGVGGHGQSKSHNSPIGRER